MATAMSSVSSGARQDSSVSSHFWRAPHRKVALLLALSLVLAFTASGITIFSLRAPSEQVDSAALRLVPVSTQLENAQTIMAGLNKKALAAMLLPAADRAAASGLLAADYASLSSSLAAYRSQSLDLPGEAALRTIFETQFAAQNELAVRLLTPAPVDATQVNQYATIAADLSLVLNQIHSIYADRIASETHGAVGGLRATRLRSIECVALGVLILTIVALLMIHALRRNWRTSELFAQHNELETRLHRALEMAADEASVYEIVQEALVKDEHSLQAELLVADSSRAHLRRVLATNLADDGGGCPVGSPVDCPAARRGQTQVFASSRDLDACPQLRHRAGGPLSCACIPVSIAGNTVGIVHAMSQEHSPPSPGTVATLELVARRAGERIGMLRAFARSETQARTDPLTGLLNRRSLENQARDIIESGFDYSIAYGDLDHFKLLNDVHGHDAGDNALRLFSRVLRNSVRPTDVPARYGGEEFVVVLPQCNVADARVVLERVRQQLAMAQRDGHGPEFTVSFGIASSERHDSFSDTVEAADGALLAAKAGGRNRIVIADAATFVDVQQTEEPGAATTTDLDQTDQPVAAS